MWFTENAWPPMLISGLAALVFFGLWNNDRRKVYFALALTCMALIGGFFVLERATETEGERLQGVVNEICDQFRRRDPKTLDHFSKSVPEWRNICKQAMEMVEVKSPIRTTAFETTFSNNDSRAKVHFRANADIEVPGEGGGHQPLRCILTFQKEEGAWKIVAVQRLDPINGKEVGTLARH